MSVCVAAEQGECLVTDNPKNTFIHSDFHTVNHGIILDHRQSSIDSNILQQWAKPDAKYTHTFAQQGKQAARVQTTEG